MKTHYRIMEDGLGKFIVQRKVGWWEWAVLDERFSLEAARAALDVWLLRAQAPKVVFILDVNE